MSVNINVGNSVKKTKSIFINVGGQKKKIKSMWVNKNRVATKVYNNVTSISPRFVCCGYGKSFYSTDGLTWNPMGNLIYPYVTSIYIKSIAYGNGRFVCVGHSGVSFYSTDGLTWNPMNKPEYAVHHNSVVYGKDRFVCVGFNGRSYYSTDGVTWNPMNKTTRGQSSVTYGNGRFVSVGDSGGAYYSTDGVSWSDMPGLAMNLYDSVAYGNGRFICTTSRYVSDGTEPPLAYQSTNGRDWTPMVSEWQEALSVKTSIVYARNKFVSVNNYYVNSFYCLDKSNNWISSQIDENFQGKNCIAFGMNKLICMGTGNYTGSTRYGYYSENYGISWNVISFSDGLTDPIEAIAYGGD